MMEQQNSVRANGSEFVEGSDLLSAVTEVDAAAQLFLDGDYESAVEGRQHQDLR